MELREVEQEGVTDYVNSRSKLEEEAGNRIEQLKMFQHNTVDENCFIEGRTEWEERKFLIKKRIVFSSFLERKKESKIPLLEAICDIAVIG